VSAEVVIGHRAMCRLHARVFRSSTQASKALGGNVLTRPCADKHSNEVVCACSDTAHVRIEHSALPDQTTS